MEKIFLETEEKICSKCKIKKKFSEFTKKNNTSHGLDSWCKKCVTERNRIYKKKKRIERQERIKKEYADAELNFSKYAKSSKKAFFFPKTNEKICAKCSEKKSTGNFFKHDRTQDGFHSWCKDCCKLGQKDYIKRKYKDFDGRIKDFIRNCKNSAKKRGQECTINRDDLIKIWEDQAGKCKYSGIEMTTQPGEMESVSVERISSEIGYTKENIVLVCNCVNRMKSDLRLDEFLFICSKIYEKKKNYFLNK